MASNPPFHRDPLATYDALGRKQPKRVGLIEVLRALPWMMGVFERRVPPEFYALEGDVAVVACQCKTEQPPRVPFNVVTRCDGEGCGRWFFFDGDVVRVAREP